MKRKFFSLMVAACAALFSVSGLTGCGGGGGEDGDTYGVVSLSDFATGRKSFFLQLSKGCKLSAPETKSDEVYELPEGSGNTERIDNCTLYVNGTPIPVSVEYHVEWPAGEPYPTDGQSGIASGTGTWLLIDVNAGYETNTTLLSAFGLSTVPGLNELSGPVVVGLQFASNKCDYTIEYIQYAEPGKPADKSYQDKTVTGCTLYAVKGSN